MERTGLAILAVALVCAGCGDGGDTGLIAVSNNGAADAGDTGADGGGDGGETDVDTGPVDPRCEGLEDGDILEEGEPTECGGFETPCARKGTQARTDTVCRRGQVVDENVEVNCERDTEGTVVESDEFGECEGFDDDCDEMGTHSRPVTVCRQGQPVEEVETADCERDTDGTVLEEGDLGECGGFEDACDEEGVASRPQTVCTDGVATEEEAEEPCSRDTDGTVVEALEPGECGGFDGTCDESGTRLVPTVICREGEGVTEDVTEDCSRDTDGVVAETGEFGECGGFDDACDEGGTWTRIDVVCAEGEGVDTEVTEECARDTDGVVVEVGEFGACGGFDGTCDESGTWTRTDSVCANGQPSDVEVTQGCSRDTDGTLVEAGEFGECGGFQEPCGEAGTQTRTDVVCEDGAEVEAEVIGDCSRDTEGQVLDEVRGECGGFDGPCAENGTQFVTGGVCRDGEAQTETRSEACTRDTDGMVTDPGEGACGAFENACDETGTRTRVALICDDGEEVPTPITEDCSRDTDGLVVAEGEPGECGGFDTDCDETGTAPRADRVCRGGEEVDETTQVECTRDTDGVVLDPGEFGECGRFEDDCDEDGVEVRVETRCQNGEEGSFEFTRDCVRDTDGEVVQEGELGECGGFEAPCDETGVTERTDIVCEDGEGVPVLRESVDCTRDTDGVVVDAGEFGECGGFEGLCGTEGTRQRPISVCRDGAEVPDTETEGCSRETEGQVVVFGEFGDCIGFEDDCDEEGVHRRNNIVCEGGEPTNVLDEEVCQRVPEDCADVCIPDDEEPNDVEGEATLTLSEIGGVEFRELRLCEDDVDYFTFTVPQGADAVRVRLVQSPGAVLPIEIIGPGEQVLGTNSDPGTERELDIQGLGVGVHFVRIAAEPGPGGLDYELGIALYDTNGCPPDYHEPNDSQDAPAFLSRGRTSSALCAQEQDWFSFHADAFATFDLTLRYEHNGIDDPFTYLYSPDGELHDFLNPDFNDPDLEVLGQGEVRVTPQIAGEWTVLVDGAFTGRSFPYQFELDYEEPECPDAPDAFEPNETCATGAILPLDLEDCDPGTPNCECRIDQTCDAPLSCVRGRCQTGHVCGPVGDVDYYLVEVAADQQLRVRAEHFHFQGNLELEVYEPDWITLGGFSYQAGPDFEEVTINPTASGPYCIRVFARGGITANSYRMQTFVTDE